MARIRTIKPEFPQSESMGRVSREARYCFIMLWTMADDSGRLRGASRMLASLLFPYDDDAATLIDGWLTELEGENCIMRYVVEGTTYIQIVKWLEHQKIDKPSASKIPEFDDNSRRLSKPREDYPADLDLGPSTKDLGSKEGGADAQTDYAFIGHVIKVKPNDMEAWRKAYPAVPDMVAELAAADAYYRENPPKDGKWFFPVSTWLKKAHNDAKAKSSKALMDEICPPSIYGVLE